jgi:iron complex transport system ATP-binding protein
MTLQATQLSVGWPGKVVAAELNVLVEAGQVLVIAGPNGVGKSTVLKTLAKQLQPITGSITLNGVDVHKMQARDFASKVSYVPQSLELMQDLTVRELVSLGRNPHQQWWSWSASENDRTAIQGALEKTETAEFKDKYLSQLSGGEKQRALIAMALAQEPQFMLLDEPTAHLDFRHQLELVALLKELAGQKIGICLVVHDLNLMASVADRVLLLRKNSGSPSTIAASGSTIEVLHPEILKQVYDVNVEIVAVPNGNFFMPTL